MGTTAIQDQLISSIQANIAKDVNAAVKDASEDAGILGKSAVGAIARKVMGSKGYMPVALPELPANATSAELLENQKLLEQEAADDKAVSEAELKDATATAAMKARFEKLAQAITVSIAGASLYAGKQALANALTKL